VTGWWGGHHADPVVRQAMALGASQDADELGAALVLVRALDPCVVVEIGCDRGGTLYAWRQVCGRVYGITLADNGYDAGGSGLPLEPHGAVTYIGDSHGSAALEWLIDELAVPVAEMSMAELVATPQVLMQVTRPCSAREATVPVDALVLDGDHSAAGLVADLAMYGPLVRPGGLILVHDIHSGHDPRVQVHEVWPHLRAAFDTSEIDFGGPGWGIIHIRAADRFAEESRDG